MFIYDNSICNSIFNCKRLNVFETKLKLFSKSGKCMFSKENITEKDYSSTYILKNWYTVSKKNRGTDNFVINIP